MLSDQDHATVEAMVKFGGSFVQQLGELARRADADNLRRIKTAFPEYWERYAIIAEAGRRPNATTQNPGQ